MRFGSDIEKKCGRKRMGINTLSLETVGFLGLAWFLRGAHRHRCKNHAKRVMRNEYNGMRNNVAVVKLNDLEKLR